jgi:dTDP-4-amino-4,6-dideoxygalactose transaminase
MWIRLRLDIGWSDLISGYFHGVFSRDFEAALASAESCWADPNRHTVAGLSVRTGLDLLFQTLQFPSGSEVLYSAITIRDMVTIADAHQLKPVPVDFNSETCAIDLAQVQRRLTPKTKAIVIAHLFGAIPNMDAVIEFAHQHDLFVIEDCAQAWCGRDYQGHELADATLFSFGAIKTATALGGAIYHIRDPEIARQMREKQAEYAIQSNQELRQKARKFSLLKIISTKLGFSLVVWMGRRKGKSVDEVLGGMTKGFPDEDLLAQIRQRPSAATLRLLARRMTKYSNKHLERRIANARHLIERLNLEVVQPELVDARHSFWLFPLRSNEPQELLERLRSHGFDATQFGRLEIVQDSDATADDASSCKVARKMFEQTVFLPAYPGIPAAALNAMCDAIQSS